MTRIHVLDHHLDVANHWLVELAEKLGLPATEYPRALHALRAGMHAIRDRLPPSEVLDLGAQLPIVIRGFYYEGWTMKPQRIRTRAAMIARVRSEVGREFRLEAFDVLRAVIELLVAHVSVGEIRHVIATLPKPIRELWHELAGVPLATLGSPPPVRENLTRRTGYSR